MEDRDKNLEKIRNVENRTIKGTEYSLIKIKKSLQIVFIHPSRHQFLQTLYNV